VPIANIKVGKFVVISERGDLGYGHGKSGNWRALWAFSAMCDDQIEVGRRYTVWGFPLEIRLVVERVLRERDREIKAVNRTEFKGEVSRMVSGALEVDG